MRFSLRELLLATTLASLAVPALWFANLLIMMLVFVATVALIFRAVIRSFVMTGRPRAASIGFAAPAVMYLAMVSNISGEWRDEPDSNRLPTSIILQPPLDWIRSQRGADETAPAGNPVPISPALPPPVATAPPKSEHFVPIAHCLWALLFGCFGMKYAVCVYDYRVTSESSGSASA